MVAVAGAGWFKSKDTYSIVDGRRLGRVVRNKTFRVREVICRRRNASDIVQCYELASE